MTRGIYIKKKSTKERIEEQIFYSPDGCWYWTGTTNSSGYGFISINSKNTRVTRLYYRIMVGAFDNRLLICHSCDNPLCINPDHLFTGTHKENTADMIKKGRMVIVNGNDNVHSKLTEDDVMKIASLRRLKVKHSVIAEKFNVNKWTVRAIFYKKSWRHLNLEFDSEKLNGQGK